MMHTITYCLIIVTSFLGQAQNSSDKMYFDFWEGTWHREINGQPDATATRFVVKRGINKLVFEEAWRMTDPDGQHFLARGIRAWDQATKSWKYIWMSEGQHFQVWEGKKVDGHWYIYKYFDINGDRYLSRQAWIPLENGRLMRISEKSYDEGATWTLRFKEFYKRE